MCNEFLIDGRYLTDMGELQDFLGSESKIPLLDNYDEMPSENEIVRQTCLCPVDIQKFVDIVKQDAVLDGDKIVFGKHIDEVEPESRFNRWAVQSS